jgi:hypothetical protein
MGSERQIGVDVGGDVGGPVVGRRSLEDVIDSGQEDELRLRIGRSKPLRILDADLDVAFPLQDQHRLLLAPDQHRGIIGEEAGQELLDLGREQALEQCDGQPTDARIEEARVARLIEARPSLLPCFIGYQETPAGKLLPLMTDGPEGRWSLFFAENGAMTLVEYQTGEWRIQPETELLPDIRGRFPIEETRSFLLNGLRAARSKLVRSDEDR